MAQYWCQTLYLIGSQSWKGYMYPDQKSAKTDLESKIDSASSGLLTSLFANGVNIYIIYA